MLNINFAISNERISYTLNLLTFVYHHVVIIKIYTWTLIDIIMIIVYQITWANEFLHESQVSLSFFCLNNIKNKGIRMPLASVVVGYLEKERERKYSKKRWHDDLLMLKSETKVSRNCIVFSKPSSLIFILSIVSIIVLIHLHFKLHWVRKLDKILFKLKEI